MSLLAELSGSGGGALKGLGVAILPISIAALLLRRPTGPIRKLIQAGALSETTARRVNGLGIPREDVLRPYKRLRVAHRLKDGRWYVDQRRERWVRWVLWLAIGIFALCLALVVWMTAPVPEGSGTDLP